MPHPTRADGACGLTPVAEPCVVYARGGRMRDGIVREAGLSDVIVHGIAGVALGEAVTLVLPRRAGLRLRADVAGLGVTGLLLHLRAGDRGLPWRQALQAMTVADLAAA